MVTATSATATAPARASFINYAAKEINIKIVYVGPNAAMSYTAASRNSMPVPNPDVLVDGQRHSTYVAERHLALDPDDSPVEHPMLSVFFDELRDGRYVLTRPLN